MNPLLTDLLAEAMAALRAGGLVPPAELLPDGKIHRIPVEGKAANNEDGAYSLHLDAAGGLLNYWNWPATGDETHTVCLGKAEKSLTAAEREARAAWIRQQQAEMAAAREQEQAKAAERARRIWAAATPATEEHPYLKRKGVWAHGLRVDSEGNLIVPMYGVDGKIQSLQFIAPEKPADGRQKNNMRGGKLGYFPLPAKDGGRDGPLLIAEGFATAATLAELTGHAALVSFGTGNLRAVACMVREKCPDRVICLCADCNEPSKHFPDHGGCGYAKAKEAALAAGACLALCPSRDGGKQDFNDLGVKWGAPEQVRRVVADALAAGPWRPAEKMPRGFSIRAKGENSGLWHTDTKDDGSPLETWLGGELNILGRTRDANSWEWGLLLEWRDHDGNRKTWAMPMSLLAGRDNSEVLRHLSAGGYSFASSMKAKNLLYRYLTEYKTENRVTCVPSTGWHDGTFVLPEKIYPPHCFDLSTLSTLSTPTAPTKTCGQPEKKQAVHPVHALVLQTTQNANNPYSQKGTLDGWRDTIGTMAVGNSRLVFAISASLAAVLLEPCGHESGGFNFVGRSSCGKTTALLAAASVWGKGAAGGYVNAWRATTNGLEALAELHTDTCLVLDELGQASGAAINQAAYLLANGAGKVRAQADGKVRTLSSWRVLVLSSGEIGLADKIQAEGGRVYAGQMVRLLDIAADAGAGMGLFEDLHGHETAQRFADALRAAAATNYGHAARAFIEQFQRHREDVLRDIHKGMTDNLNKLCPPDASGQAQRAARRFLLVACAGELAIEWGIVPWPEGMSVNAAKACLEVWLTERGGADDAEKKAIIDSVTEFIERHGQSRFQPINEPETKVIDRAGYVDRTDGKEVFYFLTNVFQKEVVKGHNLQFALDTLKGAGLLLRGDGANTKRLPQIFGRKRCYAITLDRGNENGPAENA